MQIKVIDESVCVGGGDGKFKNIIAVTIFKISKAG